MKNSVVTKYYFAGTTRLAVRTNGTLSYLLGDHLGSSSVTTDANGAKTASALYKAFGETRYTLGALGTDYKFTGQRLQAELGIYWFQSRWMDPSLGRFTQPDTIVPTSTQGTQAWDRYAFVNNNPVRYTDPTGHMIIGDGPSHFDHTNSSTDPCLRYGKGSPQCPNSPDDNLDDIVDTDDDDGGKCPGHCAPTLPSPGAQENDPAVTLRDIGFWFAMGTLAIAAVALISFFAVPALLAAGGGAALVLTLLGVTAAGATSFATTLSFIALGTAAVAGALYAISSSMDDHPAEWGIPPTPTATPTAPHGAPFSLVTPTPFQP